MPQLKTYRGFISHSWDYSDAYVSMEKMLKDFPNFDWGNYSVPKTDPLKVNTDKELTERLHNQIKPTNHVIIIAGMYANHRKWIQKEIDIAKSYGKPIIAVKPWGSQMTPREVIEAATEVVGWNAASIVAAVRRHAGLRQTLLGSW